jgi:transcriptional regulator GlxA family with amidase domain
VRVPSVPVLVRLRLAKDLMDRRYVDPLDLNALAREAGFSRYHFARAFRAAYGEPPGAYLSRRRVERAQDLLRSADITVTEVCLLVGFSSLGSFSSVLAWSRPGSPAAGARSAIQEKPGGASGR